MALGGGGFLCLAVVYHGFRGGGVLGLAVVYHGLRGGGVPWSFRCISWL